MIKFNFKMIKYSKTTIYKLNYTEKGFPYYFYSKILKLFLISARIESPEYFFSQSIYYMI